MKPNFLKNIAWLTLTLLLALSVWHLRTQKIPSVQNERPLLPFSIRDVTHFTVINFTNGLDFSQSKDGTWFVAPRVTALQKQITDVAEEPTDSTPRQASLEKITAYLTDLSLIRIVEPVATNAKPETFQIGSQSLQITFFNRAEQTLGKLYIGKNGVDRDSTYVMRDAEREVYWVAKNLRPPLLMPIEYWLEETND